MRGLVDHSPSIQVAFTCPDGHSATFDFKNGIAIYERGGEPVKFSVVREEAVVYGQDG